MADCTEHFFCGDDKSDAVLAIFHFYGYGTNSSEAVENITTCGKD